MRSLQLLNAVRQHQRCGGREAGRLLLSALPASTHRLQQQAAAFSWLPWRARQQPADPPTYPQRPHTYRLGEVELVDPYWWLSDYEQAAPYLRQEQQHFQATVRQWAPLVQQLQQELKQHAGATQLDDPPEAVGRFAYFTRSSPHGPDTILRRCRASGSQQVVLSAEVMQADAAAASRLLGMEVQGEQLGSLKLSHDQQLLAYSLPVMQGTDQHCCIAKDLTTGALLPRGVLPSVGSFEWSPDGRVLYFSTPDARGRPSKVFRRAMSGGTSSSGSGGRDELLYEEADARHYVTLTRTKDWRFLLLNSHSKLSSEVHLIDWQQPDRAPVCVRQRRPGVEYFVEHAAGHLLVLSNQQPAAAAAAAAAQSTAAAAAAAGSGSEAAAAHDYSLYSVPVVDVAAGGAAACAWRLLVSERPGAAISDMDAFEGCVVLQELHVAGPQLRILRLQQQQDGGGGGASLAVASEQQVVLPKWALSLRPGINQDHAASSMRLYASSPAQPELPLQLDLASGMLQELAPTRGQQQQQQEGIGSSGDAAAGAAPPLACWRLWATADDGARVPLTLLQAAGAQQQHGPAPLLLEVYGAYGHVLEADHQPHRLPLLRRGWAVALAHVRGGGELGRRWHAAGRQLAKPNSVADLLACLRLLFERGVTRPGLVAGHAASAGCLTLAAALNARPAWFAAAVLEAPFVDWAGCMGDGGGADVLREHELDEWGDPSADARVAAMIAALCPYSNLAHGSSGGTGGAAATLPPMLVTAGLRDARVPLAMPAKFVAKLRAVAQAGAAGRQPPPLVLLQFDEAAGHFSQGVSGGVLEDVGVQQAFLLLAIEAAAGAAAEGRAA